MSDIAKNAKADAKGAKARARSLRPWYQKKGFIILVIIVIVVIVTSANSKKNAPANTGGQSSVTAPASGVGSSLPAFGTLVKDGDFSFRPSQLVCNIMSVGSNSNFDLTQPTGQFCRITIWIYNHSTTTQMVDVTAQYAVDKNARQYPGDINADTAGNANLNSGLGLDTMTLNPGLSVTGYLYFDMPKGDTPASFIFHDSSFSNGVTEQA